MIPSIELVLGLVGSTIGIMICVIFPAMCFICISSKNTNERILAQLMLFVGVIVMVLGTYANLYAMEEVHIQSAVANKVIAEEPEILKMVKEDTALHKILDLPKTTLKPLEDWKPDKKIEGKEVTLKEVRHEPPQPEEPVEVPKVKDLPGKKIDDKQIEVPKKENEESKLKDLKVEKNEEKPKIVTETSVLSKKNTENPVLQEPIKADGEQHKKLGKENIVKEVDNVDTPKEVEVHADRVMNIQSFSVANVVNKRNKIAENKLSSKKAEEVDKEAIEKEEKELREEEKKLKDEEKKSLDLIKSLEERNEEQKKIVEEKKKILEEIKQRQQALEEEKQQKEHDVKQKKLEAVEQIQAIAQKAIEKISANDAHNEVKDVSSPNLITNQSLKAAPLPISVGSINIKPRIEHEDNNKDNIKNHLKQSVKPEFGLNAQNLIPFPLAMSNNFSDKLNSIPAAVGIMSDVSNIITRQNVSSIDFSKQVAEKAGEKRNEEENDLRKNVDNNSQKDKNVNLFNVLRSKAEKAAVMNQNKEENVVHREIRSVDNIIKGDDEPIKPTNVDQMLPKEIITQKHDTKQNHKETKKSEESCDKEEKIQEVNKINEVQSTEAPALRMITKLSNPELVSIRLPIVDKINEDIVLKPLKRDLKSYKLEKIK